jgi:hypothetical protein
MKLHHGQSRCNRFAVKAVQSGSAREQNAHDLRASIDVEKSSYHHLSQNEMVTIIVAGNSSTFHARNEKF